LTAESLAVKKRVQLQNIRQTVTTRVQEGEESPMLEAVAMKWLLETQQTGKDLVCAVVNSRVWRLVMAL
jgi:hypothetical protein